MTGTPQVDGRQEPERPRNLAEMPSGIDSATRAHWREARAREIDRGAHARESLPGLIHDARNMVAALELYCDLLEEPGVLTTHYSHYASELRRVGAANRRLLSGLSSLMEAEESAPLRAEPRPAAFRLSGHGALAAGAVAARAERERRDSRTDRRPEEPRGGLFGAAARGEGQASARRFSGFPLPRLRSRWQSEAPPERPAVVEPASSTRTQPFPLPESLPEAQTASLARSGRRSFSTVSQRVASLAEEVRANRNLLAALVGHSVTVGMSIRGGAHPIAMTNDDLTRVLVNLASNAAEAMPSGGHLQIVLEESHGFMTLSFTDSGPGIPEYALESIFSPGFSTHIGLQGDEEGIEVGAWPVQHRGLGLSIVRSLVSAAGGAVWAANRAPSPFHGASGLRSEAGSDAPPNPHGAVFTLEFPLPIAEDRERGARTPESAPEPTCGPSPGP